MIRATHQKLGRTIRVQRYRSDRRLILALSLAIALLTASTVISSEAWLRLPTIWLVEIAGSPTDSLPLESHDAQSNGEQSTAREASERSPVDGRPSEGTPSELVYHLTAEDYTESWRQAGDDFDDLGETLRSYQVNVGPAGRLVGQLSTFDPQTGNLQPLADVRVWISHRGRITATALTDTTGVFDLKGLETGTSALFASGDDILIAFALHVRQVETDDDEPVGIRLDSPAVRGPDVSTVLSLMAATDTGGVPPVREIEPDEAQIPEPVRPLKQVGAFATPLVTHPVQLRRDGRLIGRVRRLHPESGRHLLPQTTRVSLIRGGVVVATAETDNRGWFAMADVTPGVYALFARTIDESEQVAAIDEMHQPVGATDGRRQPAGFATFAVAVTAADGHPQRPSSPSDEFVVAGESLELEFALIEHNNWLAFTRERGSSLQSTSRTVTTGNAGLSGESRGLAPQAPASSPPVLVSTPPAGGGNGFPISFVPPDNDNRLISPPSP